MTQDNHRTAGLTVTPGGEVRTVRVVAVDGPGAGAHGSLTGGLMVLGSGAGSDLIVADEAVSRRHASLELLPGAVRVVDLESRNGVFYLEARIREATVPIGGVIRIGRTTLRITAEQETEPISPRRELGGLLGESLAMRRVFARLERLAPFDTTVLFEGETGTGKETAARALHSLSARANKPFRVFDCAASNGPLLESELFGHVAGAFTDARQDRAGALALAEGGALFLDGVDEMPLQLQPKLLRLLEAREWRPLGGSQTLTADVRILASTQEPLEALVAAGRFRSDLFYRLEVARVVLPSLRSRPEDVALLAAHFARTVARREVRLGSATLATLQSELWPGNVRELRNAVERALALGELKAPVSAPEGKRRPFKEAREKLVAQFERDYLNVLLEAHGKNLSNAAREAGISRMTLYRLVQRYGLSAEGESE